MKYPKSHGFLIGWKEIADYLSVSVRTVQRNWRKWKLPLFFLEVNVYKIPAAHIADLEEWRKVKILSAAQSQKQDQKKESE